MAVAGLSSNAVRVGHLPILLLLDKPMNQSELEQNDRAEGVKCEKALEIESRLILV